MAKLTETEKLEHKRIAQRKYAAKKKAEMEKLQSLATNNAPDAKDIRIKELENLCKNYAERAMKAEEALKKATLNYDALKNYYIDCAKHAYLAMNFAAKAGIPHD